MMNAENPVAVALVEALVKQHPLPWRTIGNENPRTVVSDDGVIIVSTDRPEIVSAIMLIVARVTKLPPKDITPSTAPKVLVIA